jgi:hypothetical protein
VEAGVEAYDVFISHASEDKETIVRSLVSELVNQGLKVWFDEFTLRIGDSLRQKIDKGLVRSRVGLVVLSPSFIAKGWTNYELDGIVTRAVSGEQLLVPRGFAHGFCTLTDNCEIAYKVDGLYAPQTEGGVLWNDPDLAIDWPVTADRAILSDKDKVLPRLRDMPRADF